MFDETKFFGYFKPSLVIVLMDISEFGLIQPTRPRGRRGPPVGPRFYMKYLEEVWFLLFVPGKREGFVGYSDRIIRDMFPDDDPRANDDPNPDANPDADADADADADEDADDDASDYDEEDKKMAAEERAIAQAFDVKLEQEVSQGKEKVVDITKKLGGWSTSTLQSSLEEAQFSEAIMSLPSSHPAYKGFMTSFFHSLRSR